MSLVKETGRGPGILNVHWYREKWTDGRSSILSIILIVARVEVKLKCSILSYLSKMYNRNQRRKLDEIAVMPCVRVL